MRPYALTAALVAATLATPASAATCSASAEVPEVVGLSVVFADGSFSCNELRTGMTVSVCLEVLDPAAGLGWQPHEWGCGESTNPWASATVSSGVVACFMTGPLLVRTQVTGFNDAGESGSATSVPVLITGLGSCI